MSTPNVKFVDPIRVNAPNIIATGTSTFNQGPRNDVVFDRKIPLPYSVFVQPDAGYQGRLIAPLAVTDKKETGFIVRSADGNSRASFDWAVFK